MVVENLSFLIDFHCRRCNSAYTLIQDRKLFDLVGFRFLDESLL